MGLFPSMYCWKDLVHLQRELKRTMRISENEPIETWGRYEWMPKMWQGKHVMATITRILTQLCKLSNFCWDQTTQQIIIKIQVHCEMVYETSGKHEINHVMKHHHNTMWHVSRIRRHSFLNDKPINLPRLVSIPISDGMTPDKVLDAAASGQSMHVRERPTAQTVKTNY